LPRFRFPRRQTTRKLIASFPLRDQKLRVVLIGDSRIARWPASPMSDRVEVINRGIGGLTMRSAFRRRLARGSRTRAPARTAGMLWSVCCGRRCSGGSPATRMSTTLSGCAMIRRCVGSSAARPPSDARRQPKPRWVIAKVEWHPGELYPRVGFIVTNAASRKCCRILQQTRRVRTVNQRGKGRDQRDAAVMPLVRRQRRPPPASCARLQSRQFPSHAGDARADQGLVADEPQRETHQDRREGC
jgi:hypothetical protein